MNTATFQKNIEKKKLPQAKATSGTLSNLQIEFHEGKEAHYQLVLGDNATASGSIHEDAKLLVEHMEIVEDSRAQIKKGNFTRWDELKKTHERRKK